MHLLTTDTARQHRFAAVFALAFAVAAVLSMSGVFALDITHARVAPLILLDFIPDSWSAQWLKGALPAASQQSAAAQQWLHVLLIFCAAAALFALTNAFIGLLSHANERRYENALRGLVGAAARVLARSQLRAAATNALLAICAGAPLGIALALLLRRTWHGELRAAAPYGWIALGIFACLLVAVLAARSAARRFHRAGWLGDALAAEARSTPGFGAADLRDLLTTAQIACAIALTIVGMLVWSYTRTAASPAQHAAADRYVARIYGTPAATQRLLSRIAATGDVQAESIASAGALLGIGKVGKVLSNCGQCFRAHMLTPLFPVETQQHVVGANFFAAAGVTVRQGREFSDAKDDRYSVIINQSFARLAFDDPVPVGKELLPGGLLGPAYKVIGIVEDLPAVGLHTLEPEAGALVAVAGAPAIYFSARAYPPAVFDVVVQAPRPFAMAGLNFEPLGIMLQRAQAPQRWFAQVVVMLGMLLCAAALLSVFITIMLNVEARRSEIAIRRAVGARRRHIVMLVLRALSALLLRAAVAGVFLSLALSRVVEVFVPGLHPFKTDIMLAVLLGFAATALLATVPPLRSALRVAPGIHS